MEQKRQTKRNKARRAILWIAGAVFVLLAAVLIHYRGVRPIVTIEYGSKAEASDFTAREASLETDGPKPALGWHVMRLYLGKFLTPVVLHVRDTVAPTAEPVDREVAVGGSYGPDAFVKNIKDADVVQLTFAEQPDFTCENAATVEIRLRDSSNNKSAVNVHISVRATHPELTLEAGAEVPTVEDFLLDGVSGALDEPIDPACMHHVGTTKVSVTTEDGLHSVSELTVADTVAPVAQGLFLHLQPNETVQAEDCITGAVDETDLTYTFLTKPDYDRRDVQMLIVRITDEGGNQTDVSASLLISGVRAKTVEARLEPLTAADFENSEGDEITVEPFVPSVPGSYPVGIVAHGVAQTLVITVVDTTAPLLLEKNLPSGTEFYTKHSYTPEDFFEVSDISDVTMTFSTVPDWGTEGEQTLTVVAEDTYGNRATRSRTVVLHADLEAPSIYGVIDRTCYVNEPIAYFREVFAEDKVDGRLEVTVQSEVATYQAGSYRVVYRTVDLSGNETVCECTYTLIEQTVTEEQIKEIAKAVMAEITTPDMTDAEKLKAIFDYVQKHVSYVNGSNHNYTDWRKAAYDGFTYGKGDCFNIYSVTRALLDETDIQYLSVERVKTYRWRTRHYWVHVNVGTGWYVFDPTWTPRHRYHCFMWTKAQCNSCRLYWNYDESKYPPLASEPFDYDAVIASQRQK